jgi:LacI family transcriptional regulator
MIGRGMDGGYRGRRSCSRAPIDPRPSSPEPTCRGGVLQAVAEARLSVPGDISVTGYDNTTFAALGPFSLTTVDQAGRAMGDNAARLLLERIADRRNPSMSIQVKLSPSPIPRRTTAPAPRWTDGSGAGHPIQPFD